MKRILLSLVLGIVSLFAINAEDYAQATFPVQSHDFGVISEKGGPVSCTFEVINTGNKPLLILDVLVSCGCTRPEFSTKPIKPGKKGKIKVTFSPLGRAGAFHKSIKVKTNGRETRTTLSIEGTIRPGNKKN
ncbi:MAG: DUF1573 domain-containing protein [Muribaculaceae bacterium]|nr:DUF1573 domain-containing protein [Muribaculaceae bacterium]